MRPATRSARGPGLDRRLSGPAPLRPRAVIDRGVGPADEMDGAGESAGGAARAAAGADRLPRREPPSAQAPFELLRGQRGAGLGIREPIEGQAAAAGNVAAAEARPWLRSGTLEAALGAGINQLLAPGPEIAFDVGLGADHLRSEARREARRCWPGDL